MAANREFCKVKCRSGSVMARWSIECNVSARSLFSVLSVFQTFINGDEDLGPSFLSSFPVFGLFYHFYGFLDSSLVPGSNFSRLYVTFSTISSFINKYEDFDSSRSLNF